MLDLLWKSLRGHIDAVHIVAVDEERASTPQGVGETHAGDWGTPATGVEEGSLGHGCTVPVAR